MKPPEFILTEAVRDALDGRKIEHLLFTTHDLQPQFFEEEILPSLFDDDFKHTRLVRLAQIDQRLRSDNVGIDVYFEPGGLQTAEGTAQLGWNRIPLTGHRGGVFHPKVTLALCHPVDDPDGPKSLVAMTASANLTRNGWWTNVEVGHVHVIEQGTRDRYAAGLRDFVRRLRSASQGLVTTNATHPILAFLRSIDDYTNSSYNARLHPHFYPGRQDVPQYLASVLGNRLMGLNLEVIAPFVDSSDVLPALTTLVDRFRPRDFRVMIPVDSGKIACSTAAYDYVQDTLGGTWGRLPSALLKHGSGLQAGDRRVHAKVYRFWSAGANRVEYIFAGSPNLTSAAHSGTRNLEAAVLLQNPKPGALSWWLDRLDTPPLPFAGPVDEIDTIQEGTADLPLLVAYDWKTSTASAFWNSSKPRTVTLRGAGVELASMAELPAKQWIELDADAAQRIRDRLFTSCTVTVHAHGDEWAPVLIQEDNHELKPDLLRALGLSPAEIMSFWSQLSTEERIARLGDVVVAKALDEEDLEPPDPRPIRPDSMFDRFAGVFHGFGSLRRHVIALLEEGNPKEAGRRLFGASFDSPLRVLELVREEQDDVQSYVTYQCAAQLLEEMGSSYPEFVADFPTQREALEESLEFRSELRMRLNKEAGGDLDEFLEWFDRWFLDRVTGAES